MRITNGLGPRIKSCIFSCLKHANFSVDWEFLGGEKVRNFNEKKNFPRCSIIINSQTVYYTYVTNKNKIKVFGVMYT